MRFLPVLLLPCYCVSLLSLQLLALRAEERPDSDRLELINQLFDVSEDQPPTSPPPPPFSRPFSKWLSSLLRRSPAAGARRPIPSSLSWAHPSTDPTPQNPNPAHKQPPQLLLLRSRRHLSSRGTHHHQYPQRAQLMRVGCVLGTCQVQNLSHRLYQLIGQSGREDSSPINPRSPHSYG